MFDLNPESMQCRIKSILNGNHTVQDGEWNRSHLFTDFLWMLAVGCWMFSSVSSVMPAIVPPSDSLAPIAASLVQRFQQAGFSAYWVGGSVPGFFSFTR